jgi:hypothetical protein
VFSLLHRDDQFLRDDFFRGFLVRLIWIVLILLFSGCGGDDDDNSESEPTQTSSNVPINQQAKLTNQSLEEFLVGMNLHFSLFV